MEDSEFVPTIDISPLFGHDETAKKNVAQKIDEVCRGTGFFYASNHGVDLEDLFAKTTEFHQQISDEEKQRIAIYAWNKKNTKQIRNGYQPPVKGKKPVEAFCYLNPNFNEDHPLIRKNLTMHEVNVWPDAEKHPGFKEYHEKYYNKMVNVTSALLRGFALALGKDERFFESYFKSNDTLSSVVLIRYPYIKDYPPTITAPDGTKLGFGSHQDACFITVLAQTNVQNLQVETEDGSYRDVPPSDKHFLVNVGGYMDHVTNGYYRSVWHRVKHVNCERLSIPFFANLGYYDCIEPFHPSNESPGNLNTPLAYGEYLENGLLNLIKSNGQR